MNYSVLSLIITLSCVILILVFKKDNREQEVSNKDQESTSKEKNSLLVRLGILHPKKLD